MSDMEFHPLANLFPMLDEQQAEELASDIRANGLRQAITTLDGKILDGRNRYLACVSAGAEPRFKEFTGDDPLGYVDSLNLNRRHLDGAQRAIVAAKIATLKDGQRQVGKFADVATQHQAAAMMNVSERSVRSARHVLDHGSPELIASVEQGKVSVSAAARIVRPPSRDEFAGSNAARRGMGIFETLTEAERHESEAAAASPLRTLSSDEFRAAETQGSQSYVRPADKYLNAQEERLVPVEAAPTPKIGDALKTLLRGNRATLVSWMRQHHDAGIPAVLAALAGAIAAIERQLAA